MLFALFLLFFCFFERLFVEDLFEESLLFLVVILTERRCKSLEKLLLFGRKVLRSLHKNSDDKVSATFTVHVRDTLSAECEGRIRLSSLGNVKLLRLATDDRNVDLGAERSFGK